MKGDFTRDTFELGNHYSRVLMQQGRVQVDADWNEQTSILLHYLRALAADLIGPYGGPGDGFKVSPISDDVDFQIFEGHYYVNGILCDNQEGVKYSQQDDYPLLHDYQLANGRYLVYLDVWECHITHNVDDSIREAALGGPDTATRAKVIWQVRTERLDSACLEELEETGVDWPVDEDEIKRENIHNNWDEIVKTCWQAEDRGNLRAWAKETDEPDSEEPCIIAPESRYRGPENQLYRVEIHRGSGAGHEPTFKWSRENGSVVFPIRSIEGQKVAAAHLGRDSRFTLQEKDWVEVVDDDVVLHGKVNPLCQVQGIDRIDMTVTLDKAPTAVSGDKHKHPLLRCWDHKSTSGEAIEYGLEIVEGEPITLEYGVQIEFAEPESGGGMEPVEPRYRTGDYWLIPARTETGDVEWPRSPGGEPIDQPPHGVEHHYAPLAIISVEDETVKVDDDCRCTFPQLCTLGA